MQQTPLVKLQHRKDRIRLESCEKERKLNDHFSYMRKNAGGLAFAGLSSLLSSRSKKAQRGNNNTYAISVKELFSPLNLLSTFSAGKGLLPVAFEIAQPFLITWGFKIVRKLVRNTFAKKKN